MDDVERRLRRDAEQQPDFAPPSLTAALTRATARRKTTTRALPLAVAAGVVVIAGSAAIAGALLSSGPSGGSQTGSGGAREGTLPPGMAVRGVWIDPRHPQSLHVVIGYASGVTSCPGLLAADARLVSQAASVSIRVDAYAVGEQPPPGTSPTTLVPFATPSAPEPTSTFGPGSSSDCAGVPDLPIVQVRAALASRPVAVNGLRIVPTEIDFPAAGRLPSGYALSRGTGINPTRPNQAVHSIYLGPGGAQLIVSYGPAAQLDPPGAVVGSATVHGRPATVTTGNGTRTLTWTLPAGTALQVQSRANHPLSTATLLAVADALH